MRACQQTFFRLRFVFTFKIFEKILTLNKAHLMNTMLPLILQQGLL